MLRPEIQREIDRINAIPSDQRTSAEADFLTARAEYIDAEEPLLKDIDGLVVIQAGRTLPTGSTEWKKGGLFIKKNASGNGLYMNTAADGVSAAFDLIDQASTANIDDGAVTTDKIAALAVTAAKLAASLDFTGKTIVLPASSVDSAAIAAGAVGASELDASIDLSGKALSNLSVEVGTPVNAVAATGSITFGAPDNGDTVVVNGNTFTKVAAAPGANEFTDIAELEALVEAVSGLNSSENGTVVSITAATAGAAGNAITLAVGGGNTGTLSVSGATLTGGVNGTVGTAKKVLADSSYLYIAIAANTVADANWRRIALGSAF